MTVQSDSGLAEVSADLGRKLGVVVGPTLRASAHSWLAWRLWPGLGTSQSADVSAQLGDVVSGSDWVWLAWWQGAASLDWGILQESGGKVTWDFDALSLWHWTAARAALPTRPIRAAQRVLSGASLRVFENRYLNKLDAVSVPSARDERWLARRLSRPVLQVRNVADLEALSPVRAVSPSSSKPIVLFVGSLYEPNVEGVRWFLRRVWPSVVAEVPQSRFLIVGRGMKPELFGRLPPGVRVVGQVPDVRRYLRDARVVVGPVFFGGGVPNKVLESAAGRRPTVVSPYVARTLGDADGFAVGEHSSQWSEALIRYLVDPAAADADGLTAYRNVEANYSLARWHGDMLKLEAMVGA